jgi:hypothetical protein
MHRMATPLNHRTEFHLVAYFREEGLRCIDNRCEDLSKTGALWVIGGRELTPVMDRLYHHHGIQMKFTPNGGRASGYQPAWYTH